MKKFVSSLLLSLFVVCILSIPALAANPPDSEAAAQPQAGEQSAPPATTPSTDTGFGTGLGIPGHGEDFDGYSDWISAVYDFSIKLGGILTVLMLIYAGYKYMTSQGNPSAINEAKEILFGSLSGFAMLLLVYFILDFLNLTNVT